MRRRQGVTVEHDLPAPGRQQARDYARKRRFTGATFPHHGQCLARVQVHTDVIQHGDACAVPGSDVGDAHDRRIGRLLALMVDGADGDERLRICLLRVFDDLARGAIFHRLAMAQHHDLIGHLRDHSQVMRDVERGNPGQPDRVFDRSKHIDLGGHVQRCRRLIEDDQIGLGAQRHSRHHTLQLPARDLMRIALADGFRVRQGQGAEQFDRARLRLSPCGQPVFQRGLDHLIDQPVRGVKSRRRRLRHIAHLPPA